MLHNTTSAGATTTIIPAEHISTSSQVTTIPSSSLSSPTTVRLWFPEGEQRTRFRQILANAPDPALKMKKKSVRFEQNASSSSPTGADTVASTSIPEELRSKNDCPVASSAAKPPLERKPPQSSSPPSPSSSSTSPGGSLRQLPVGYVYTKVPVAPPPVMVDHKDPEEKLAELMDLKKLRVRQEDLFHLKDQIFQMNQTLEEKEELLDEVRSERKSLQSELNRYVTMIKQIQKDYELTSQAEAQLIKERDDISQQLGQMRESDYKSLKDEVDHMRTKRGFRPLPSLEQEQAEVMGRYLEERRGQWRHGGDSIQGASSSSGASLSDAMLQISLFPETSTAGSSSSSSARVTNNTLADESTSSPSGSGSRSKSLRNSASSSSPLSGSPSSRGRDTGSSSNHARSGKSPSSTSAGGSSSSSNSNSSSNSHSQSGHARTSSSSNNKSRHESSSSSNRRSGSSVTGEGSSSRSGQRGQSRSRDHSPAPVETARSSSSQREERFKKRARY